MAEQPAVIYAYPRGRVDATVKRTAASRLNDVTDYYLENHPSIGLWEAYGAPVVTATGGAILLGGGIFVSGASYGAAAPVGTGLCGAGVATIAGSGLWGTSRYCSRDEREQDRARWKNLRDKNNSSVSEFLTFREDTPREWEVRSAAGEYFSQSGKPQSTKLVNITAPVEKESDIVVSYWSVNHTEYSTTKKTEGDEIYTGDNISDYKGIEKTEYAILKDFAPVLDKELWQLKADGKAVLNSDGLRQHEAVTEALAEFKINPNGAINTTKLTNIFDINGDGKINIDDANAIRMSSSDDTAIKEIFFAGSRSKMQKNLERYGIKMEEDNNGVLRFYCEEDGQRRYFSGSRNEIVSQITSYIKTKRTEFESSIKNTDLNKDGKTDNRDLEIMMELLRSLVEIYDKSANYRTCIRNVVSCDNYEAVEREIKGEYEELGL